MPAISMQDLENAKTDVDHIAAVATSLAPTATDRLGHVKQTLAGAVGSIAAITDRGAWATGAAYLVKDLVTVAGVVYICVSAHTAGATFAGDSAKWRVYQGLLAEDLANTSDPAKGAGMVGYDQSLDYPCGTVGRKLSQFVNVEDIMTEEELAGSIAGTVNVSGVLQSALNTYKYVILTAGHTYLAGGLTSVADGALMCVGGRATVKVPSGNTYGLQVNTSDFLVDGVNFDGGNTGPYNNADAVTGGRVGLSVGNFFGTGAQLNNITVQNVDCYGFDRTGFYGGEVQIGSVFGKRVTLHNLNCHHNYINIELTPRFEYVNATLCYGYEGNIGIHVQGGNNKFTSCSFENNWTNAVVTAGENNSHGGFVNCSFNHAMAGGLGLHVAGNDFGEAFTNCFFWYSPIKLESSTGVQIRNSQIVNSPITVIGGGLNSIDDNYIRAPFVPTLVGYTFTTFRRNRTSHVDTSLQSFFGDLYLSAADTSHGSLPLAIGTSGVLTELLPVFSYRKWHGVESGFLVAGWRGYIPVTGMYDISAAIVMSSATLSDFVTIEIGRYDSSGTLVDTYPASLSIPASQEYAALAVSDRVLLQGGDTLGLRMATQSVANLTLTKLSFKVCSVD